VTVGRRAVELAGDSWAWLAVSRDEVRALRALRAPSNGDRVVHSKLLSALGLEAGDLEVGGEVVGYLRLLWRREDGRVFETQLARRGAGPVAWRVDPAVFAHGSALAAFERLTTA